jgi:hypothetical protein
MNFEFKSGNKIGLPEKNPESVLIGLIVFISSILKTIQFMF